MKHLLTAIACCLAVAGSAQSDAYPFNPDSDGDGLIGVEDLLALLSDFGMGAEFETCFRGEAYKLEGSTYDSYNYYIPADCGIFTRYDECIYPWGCYNRLPIDSNDGDVIYGWLRRSYYYNTTSINFQTWENDEWTTFFFRIIRLVMLW